MSFYAPPKDPQATLDYALDWLSRGWLQGGDTIVASTWEVTGPDSELIIESDSNTSGVATVWLSGGTLNGKYTVTNHIVTSEGREDDRSIIVKIRNL